VLGVLHGVSHWTLSLRGFFRLRDADPIAHSPIAADVARGSAIGNGSHARHARGCLGRIRAFTAVDRNGCGNKLPTGPTERAATSLVTLFSNKTSTGTALDEPVVTYGLSSIA